jgi:hypothetical protein
MLRHIFTRLLIVVAILAGACSSGGDEDDGTVSTRGTAAATTTTAAMTVPAFDWSRPRPVDLGGGWLIEDCEGDAPLFCVRRDGEIVGSLEALRFDLEGKTPQQQADAFLETFRGDRTQTCPAHTFTAEQAIDVTTADGAAIRYGFTLSTGNDVVERVVQFAGERDGKHVVIAANAVDEGGCLAREGEFATANLIAFEPRLDALIRASGLP